MDINVFIKEHGGEILANKLRVHHEDKVVIVARLEGEEWVPTEAGAKLEHDLNVKKETKKSAEKPAEKPAPKPAPKTRKK